MNFGMVIVRFRSYVVCVWLHPAADPGSSDWDACVDRIRKVKEELKGDISRIRSLVVTDGGAPNAKQRTELFSDVLEGRGAAAVVTCSLTNPIKRGVAVALSWLNPHFRAIDPERAEEALAHIDCDGAQERDKIWNALLELQRALPPVKSLQQMATRLGRPNPIGKSTARSG